MRGEETIEVAASDIAIVGMAMRVPGARNPNEFWKNLERGVESTTQLTDEELEAGGESPALIANPQYVKSAALLQDMEKFDAGFFGFSPKDAGIMDPQHRHFLECAWEALEHAGYQPDIGDKAIGVYAGCGMGAYMMYNLMSNPALMESVGEFLIRHTGNDKDFLAPRVSYELNLKGPSVNVQTACSSSLVAVHLASQSLLNGECDMALAGGVTIVQPHRRGYLFKENEILSPDGHCRAFDANSRGTIFGSGAAIVVLKRLGDAIEDGDTIHTVLKGSAINNDGSEKVGYLAPSVDGQAQAVAEAIAIAGIDPETIGYLECHGTGTPVGDPIEITALTQAFRESTGKNGFCAIGSVKTNIGHLDTAAGVAGLIKAALALKNKTIPPSLNYESPNPEIDFPNTPFFVNTKQTHWDGHAEPRRASVNSLGIGGTNAHAVLEEPPELGPSSESCPYQLLLLSAKSGSALKQATDNFAEHLKENSNLDLADAAYTLQVGRVPMPHRRAVVCKDLKESVEILERLDPKRVTTQVCGSGNPSLVFMFPGGGAQYAGMGADLYASEPIYRKTVDACAEFINPKLGLDLRELMFPSAEAQPAATKKLESPSLALPALFTTEYAIAKLLMSWGVSPETMIGHSMGEYVVACLAGVISYQDGLSLVATRGRLFEQLPSGGMLSIPLPAEEVEPLLGSTLSFAAINAPSLCVASGPVDAIAKLEQTLQQRDVECTRIHINVAAHSKMLEPILEEFEAFCRTMTFKAPERPYISNLTGDWIQTSEATDPMYWVKHLRHSVQFAGGLNTLLKEGDRVFLEIGPGRTLSSLARQQELSAKNAYSTIRHPKEEASDVAFLLGSVGQLWTSGVSIDWSQFHSDELRYRVPLPTYAWDHQEFFIEPGKQQFEDKQREIVLRKKAELGDWFYIPTWKQTPASFSNDTEVNDKDRWLIFMDECGVGARFASRLKKELTYTVKPGKRFAKLADRSYSIDPSRRSDVDELVQELRGLEFNPNKIVHLWALSAKPKRRLSVKTFEKDRATYFESLLHLAQIYGLEAQNLQVTVVSNRLHALANENVVEPEKSLVLGPCRVIPHEYPNISCQSVDIDLSSRKSEEIERAARTVFDEISEKKRDRIVAYRGSDRWIQTFETAPLEAAQEQKFWLRSSGVYLITGGLGGIGLELAKHLTTQGNPKLVLVGRSPLPERFEWDTWVAEHDKQDLTRQRIEQLLSLESLGAEVLPLSADVTDLAQMKHVIEQTRSRFGTLHGVIHAAGSLDDNLIQLKTAEEAAQIIAPKARGALVLGELFRRTDLDFMVLFSSVSSLLGIQGQVDYTAANAYLDAFAKRQNQTESYPTVAINWSAWKEVGMAAKRVADDEAASEESEGLRGQPTEHPFLEQAFDLDAGETQYVTCFSRDKQWLLSEHVIRGAEALIPGSGFLELARAALEQNPKPGAVELSGVVFLSPFAVPKGEEKTLRITLKQTGAAHAFSMESENSETPHVTGHVAYVDADEPQLHDIGAIQARCHGRCDDLDGYLDQVFLDFGPRWGNIWKINYGEKEALASLELPAEFAKDLATFKLHPALLDMATGCAQPLIPDFDSKRDFFIPFSYGRLRLLRALPVKLFSHIKFRDYNGRDSAYFDVTLMDGNGREVAIISDFIMKRVSLDAPLPGQQSGSDSSQNRTSTPSGDPGAPNDAANVILENGILPKEGMDAFDRILSVRVGSQVISSSIDFLDWRDLLEMQVDSNDDSEGDLPKFARPDLATEYAPASNDVEKFLVEVWEQLLGVDMIGIDDDFFELGGHSLIAVRLFNKIKKFYDVEFGLAALFDARTIKQLAGLLTKGGEKTLTFRSLVAIRPEGKKPPLFLLHGVGGNVLNFSDLVNHLPSDQPVYGLQARGMDGKEEPLTDVADFADSYIDEIRSVQPTGPYYLVGYSFGGIVAFEMARKLTAEGETLALLGMFDPDRPNYSPSLKQRLGLHVEHIIRLGMLERFVHIGRKLRTLLFPNENDEVVQIREDFRWAKNATSYKRKVQEANWNAFHGFYPEFYSGDITLFRSMGVGRSGPRLHDLGWSDLVGGDLKILPVPGLHVDMILEPNVRTLAEQLIQTLEVAQAEFETEVFSCACHEAKALDK